MVPTWKRAEWLARCLESLAAQTLLPTEVVVVGREEDESAQDVVAAASESAPFALKWATVDKGGHIAPVQKGLSEASGEIVAFLDDDTEPLPHWMEALLEPFSDQRAACVGGRVDTTGFVGIVHPDAGRIRWYGKHVGNVAALETSGSREVDSVMECNWAWRVDILRSLEFHPVFDRDDGSMYGLDLCLQARSKGFKTIYKCDARVIHHAAPRDPTLSREDQRPRTTSYARGYTFIGLKHFRGLHRWLFVAWWFLVGERAAYGPFGGLADAFRSRFSGLPMLTASLIGKWQGVRFWWYDRASLARKAKPGS